MSELEQDPLLEQGPLLEQDLLNFPALVERLVPVVAELFVTLAAQDPLRMSFAGIAEKTVLDIVETLRTSGMSQEAVAATLDLTITGFQSKMKRLREAYREQQPGTGRRPTLLERVYGFVADADAGKVTYVDVERHFKGVKRDSLGGVLHHLAQGGLLKVDGRGARRKYSAMERIEARDSTVFDASVVLYRAGPMTLPDLAEHLRADEETCRGFLEQFERASLLEVGGGPEGETYRVIDYHIPIDSPEGYEAALWDHINAAVHAICKKIRMSRHRAMPDDRTGGTTFSFLAPVGHPLSAEISAFLSDTRTQMESWLDRARVLQDTEPQNQAWERITIYTGQMVERIDGDDET